MGDGRVLSYNCSAFDVLRVAADKTRLVLVLHLALTLLALLTGVVELLFCLLELVVVGRGLAAGRRHFGGCCWRLHKVRRKLCRALKSWIYLIIGFLRLSFLMETEH